MDSWVLFSFWRLWQGSPTAFWWGNTDTPFPWLLDRQHTCWVWTGKPRLYPGRGVCGWDSITALHTDQGRDRWTGAPHGINLCSAHPIFPLLTPPKLTVGITYSRSVNWGSSNKFSKQSQTVEFFKTQGPTRFRPKLKKKKSENFWTSLKTPKPKTQTKTPQPTILLSGLLHAYA